MSKRRNPDEVVRRKPGSCFLASADPALVKLVGESDDWCLLSCGDNHCREWSNVEIVEGEGKGHYLHHLSECEMSDAQEA